MERPAMPQMVVQHARVLADQLDAAPDDSPLHGRYTAVVAQLLQAADASSDELSVASAMREIFG